MGTIITEGVYFYPIHPIETTGGRVMHGIQGLDDHFPSFGEIYFSTARPNDPKAWKKHTQMICNLFVPIGAVKFVFFDDRVDGPHAGAVYEVTISRENYGRLVIHPGIWFGFASVSEGAESIVVNVANIAHDPLESFRLEPGDPKIPYLWNFKSKL